MNNKLKELQQNVISLVIAQEQDIEIFINTICEDNTEVVIKVINGKKCKTKESLLKEFATILMFPDYFGHNWDAFDECINDLSWLPAKQYILLITNFNEVLINNTEGLHIFLDIIEKTAKEWSSSNKFRVIKSNMLFNIILQCEIENESTCKEILNRENIHILIQNLKSINNIKK